jgi:hypothetical protein
MLMKTYIYYNPNILLVITQTGRIKMLYTPIRVKTICYDLPFPAGCIVFVDTIRSSEAETLEYKIGGYFYFYGCFSITR